MPPCRMGFGLLTPDLVKLSPALPFPPATDEAVDGAMEEAFGGAMEEAFDGAIENALEVALVATILNFCVDWQLGQ